MRPVEPRRGGDGTRHRRHRRARPARGDEDVVERSPRARCAPLFFLGQRAADAANAAVTNPNLRGTEVGSSWVPEYLREEFRVLRLERRAVDVLARLTQRTQEHRVCLARSRRVEQLVERRHRDVEDRPQRRGSTITKIQGLITS